MSTRKCGTCRHYEPAPIWRKGWCRNALLYSDQQNHLVACEDLDCQRAMGDYWETADVPKRESIPLVPVYSTQSLPPSEERRAATPSLVAPPRSGDGPQPDVSPYGMFAITGSSGFGDDDIDPPDRGNRGHINDYYAEEQHWTDYLRIGLPVLGALILIVLVFFIASSVFGDDGDDGQQGSSSTPTVGVINAPTATTGTGGAVVTGTPPIVATNPPGGVQTPTTGAGGGVPTATPEAPAGGGEIYVGAIVQIANGGPEGVNMRTAPGGDIVTTLADGTQLTTSGEPQEGEGYTWWPVSGEAGDGWVAQDFLTLVE